MRGGVIYQRISLKKKWFMGSLGTGLQATVDLVNGIQLWSSYCSQCIENKLLVLAFGRSLCVLHNWNWTSYISSAKVILLRDFSSVFGNTVLLLVVNAWLLLAGYIVCVLSMSVSWCNYLSRGSSYLQLGQSSSGVRLHLRYRVTH